MNDSVSFNVTEIKERFHGAHEHFVGWAISFQSGNEEIATIRLDDSPDTAEIDRLISINAVKKRISQKIGNNPEAFASGESAEHFINVMTADYDTSVSMKRHRNTLETMRSELS